MANAGLCNGSIKVLRPFYTPSLSPNICNNASFDSTTKSDGLKNPNDENKQDMKVGNLRELRTIGETPPDERNKLGLSGARDEPESDGQRYQRQLEDIQMHITSKCARLSEEDMEEQIKSFEQLVTDVLSGPNGNLRADFTGFNLLNSWRETIGKLIRGEDGEREKKYLIRKRAITEEVYSKFQDAHLNSSFFNVGAHLLAPLKPSGDGCPDTAI
ncbi:hypothetical protein BJ508DRAFT_331465 [Ascobolus immersus RN42]|uniref:Uncharacterized protein n=1 Tax=Ascobolus immersus RN42 TaxID=1160509 RepID=A0A3N4HW35_ASCIM|nr:hypothetical protein BJ508DRAFT_331465 [Ascobolus immersus RN42]